MNELAVSEEIKHKKCTKCKIVYPVEDFYIKNGKRASQCKYCERKYKKDFYKNKKLSSDKPYIKAVKKVKELNNKNTTVDDVNIYNFVGQIPYKAIRDYANSNGWAFLGRTKQGVELYNTSNPDKKIVIPQRKYDGINDDLIFVFNEIAIAQNMEIQELCNNFTMLCNKCGKHKSILDFKLIDKKRYSPCYDCFSEYQSRKYSKKYKKRKETTKITESIKDFVVQQNKITFHKRLVFDIKFEISFTEE